ncbi:MAG: phosphoribosylanthranilate isomerase [Lachnospiraceae bacterium]|nr:phosphoribosylanthranilate isomerase [Lachnospiraceae bacterium]
MKIKICGLRRIEDIDYVNQYRPDYIGYVFAKSKRKVDYDTAKLLSERLDASIIPVGVFVNESIDNIVKLVKNKIIKVVQLHGDEDELYIRTLRNALRDVTTDDVTIVKAIRVKSKAQIQEECLMSADIFLLDAFSETEYGGMGKRFDCDLIPDIDKPYMLAGGVNSDNVFEICDEIMRRNVKMPFCMDVSSSVETAGYKDETKIRNIINAIRSLS